MNCYIEVSWIMMTFVFICAHSFALSLIQRRLCWHKTIIASVFFSAVSVIVYKHIFLIIVFELIHCLWIYRFSIKGIVQMELTRFFLLLILKKLLQGILINGVLFLPSSANWTLSVVFLIFLSCLIRKMIAPIIYHEQFEIPIMICINKKMLELDGYLDTGNTLEYKQRPVIFLNQSYQIECSSLEGILIDYKTVNGIEYGLIYPAELYLNNQKIKVYLAFSDCLEEPVQCLLNSRLFY